MADFGIGEGIAAAGIVMSMAATAASVAAAQQQAANQQKAANTNAQINANNAQVAVYQRQQQEQEYAAQAAVTQAEGAQNASRLEMQNGALVAKNIAAAASSGLAISGSTQDVISGSAANNELQVLNEQHKTAIQAWADESDAANASYNSTIQANRYMTESSMDTSEAGYAAESGLFSEAGAGISGVSKIATATSAANNAGLFTESPSPTYYG